VSRFDAYRETFPNARLTRSATGVLEVALHTDGGTLVFNGHTHEQFVDLFHTIGSDPDNRVVILTGSGDAFMESISPDGFDFFTPQGYDKIFREGKKILMNLLDIDVTASADQQLDLHFSAGSIQGRIVDSDHLPVPGADIFFGEMLANLNRRLSFERK